MPLPADHPGIDPAHPVLLFDGHCGLCSRSVTMFIRHDPAGVLRYCPLQSPAAERLLLATNAPAPLPQSMIVVDSGRLLVRSDAVLAVVRRLRWPWPLLGAGAVIPRPLRDWLYDRVAATRYRWFGRSDACMVPTPQIAARFIDPALATSPTPAKPPPDDAHPR